MQSHTDDKDEPDRFIREAEVKRITGLGRTTRWRLAQEGSFPKPIKLSEQAVGWRLSEIRRWMDERTMTAPAV